MRRIVFNRPIIAIDDSSLDWRRGMVMMAMPERRPSTRFYFLYLLKQFFNFILIVLFLSLVDALIKVGRLLLFVKFSLERFYLTVQKSYLRVIIFSSSRMVRRFHAMVVDDFGHDL